MVCFTNPRIWGSDSESEEDRRRETERIELSKKREERQQKEKERLQNARWSRRTDGKNKLAAEEDDCHEAEMDRDASSLDLFSECSEEEDNQSCEEKAKEEGKKSEKEDGTETFK